MGYGTIRYEAYLEPNWGLLHNGTPVKTEPEILRAISELISLQVLTHQLLVNHLGGKAGGRAFINQTLRADESGAYDNSAEQIQTLTQRVEELERRLSENS
jgi:hypothetical protein